ncbi:MAG TPA: M48 family metallopeptidase [Moraxellaceae bacterium]|nr:M48 family metallopeptidase [Moraxellaceae bacterium]
MDFFEHQAHARRQTWRLLAFFIAAVALTVLALNVGFFLAGRATGMSLWGTPLWHEWSEQVLLGTLILVGGGSLREYLILRGGGQALAESLGARRIDFATSAPRERQFLNVVAEMSIASGVPAPTLYVLDREQGINAFVAGLTIDKSVMVVTAGALEAFERDELQAVVGHEFSHILNGDMRLNIRLLALLAGILSLGQAGSFLMRISSDTDTHSRRSSERRGGVIYIFAFGAMLWAIGSIGLFFGRLIKAAISRQRELLADASSVQFTRNPDGLAEALLKIRDSMSWMTGSYAESMSHMCFAESLRFSSWFATHPPLELRIAALGEHYLVRDRARHREKLRDVLTAAEVARDKGLGSPPLAGDESGESRFSPRDLAPIAFVPDGGGTLTAIDPAAPPTERLTASPPVSASLVARTGTVSPRMLASAQALYQRLPPAVLQALESSEGAQALLYAVVARHNLAPLPAVERLLADIDSLLLGRVKVLFRVLDGLDVSFFLPLTELAMPRLQLLNAQDQREFVARLQTMAQMDRHLSTFEFALLMLLRKQLQLLPKPQPVRLAQCTPEVAGLVATLLRAGSLEGEMLERTFERIMRTVISPPPSLPSPDITRLARLGRDLYRLGGLPLLEKRSLLEVAATAVLADAQVRIEEYELLRVVAALLDCPMPVLDV